MDLSNLTTVQKSYTREQNYDIRYSKATGNFQMSDGFYASKNMNNNGMTLHTAGDGTLLISLRPNEDSVFAKGKKTQENKGLGFSYSILASSLRDLGLITEGDTGFDNFKLEKVGSKDGHDYYIIKAWEESDAPETSVVDTTSEQSEQTEESEDLVASEEVSDGVKAESVEDKAEEEVAVTAEEEDAEIDPFL